MYKKFDLIVAEYERLSSLKKLRKNTENTHFIRDFFIITIIDSLFLGGLYYFNSIILEIIFGTFFILCSILLCIVLLIGFDSNYNYPFFDSFKAGKILKESKYKKSSDIDSDINSSDLCLNELLNSLEEKELIILLGEIKSKNYLSIKDLVFNFIDKRNDKINESLKEENIVNSYIEKVSSNSFDKSEDIKQISDRIINKSFNKDMLIIKNE